MIKVIGEAEVIGATTVTVEVGVAVVATVAEAKVGNSCWGIVVSAVLLI